MFEKRNMKEGRRSGVSSISELKFTVFRLGWQTTWQIHATVSWSAIADRAQYFKCYLNNSSAIHKYLSKIQRALHCIVHECLYIVKVFSRIFIHKKISLMPSNKRDAITTEAFLCIYVLNSSDETFAENIFANKMGWIWSHSPYLPLISRNNCQRIFK